MNKVITIFISILFFTSCNEKTEIESIHVLYYNYRFLGEVYKDCNKMKKKIPTMKKEVVYNQNGDSVGVLIDSQGVLDTMLTDPIILKKIKFEIKKLEKDTSINYPVDARISCVITYKGGQKERLCIGGQFATEIYYNGQPQKKNNSLLFLIKSSIKYYYWMDKRELDVEDELNDKSIKRDIIINKFGEKY